MGQDDSLGDDTISIQLGIFVPNQTAEKARSKVKEKFKDGVEVEGDGGGRQEVSRGQRQKRRRSESVENQSDSNIIEEPTVQQESGTESQDTPSKKERKRKKRKKKCKRTHKDSTVPSTETAKDIEEAALDYLDMWDRGNSRWRFKKKTQFWLLQNSYDKTKIPKTKFKILLRYLEPLKGNQKQLAIDRARDIVTKYDNGTEHSRPSYKRARAVLKTLC